MEEELMSSTCVPPGFRFHPTEEELVGYYLARKVASQKIAVDVIADVDLYRIEPWDLQEKCKQGWASASAMGDDNGRTGGWYFFSRRDRKHPGGSRTNRATAAGFWKATGRDKAVLSTTAARSGMMTMRVIGMRKTLVFYVGRAPNGRRTDWIMHEYRVHRSSSGAGPPPQEEGWVICRAFKKQVSSSATLRPCYQEHQQALSSSFGLQTLEQGDPCPLLSNSRVNSPFIASSRSSSSTAALFDDHQYYLESGNHPSSSLFLDIPGLLDSPGSTGGGGAAGADSLSMRRLMAGAGEPSYVDIVGLLASSVEKEEEEEELLMQAPPHIEYSSSCADGVICREAMYYLPG